MLRDGSDSACTPPGLGVPHPAHVPHHSRMTGSDVAMLALTFAGFALIAMLPYAAFRLVELAEDALDRARDRA